jgi:hypothetical protein
MGLTGLEAGLGEQSRRALLEKGSLNGEITRSGELMLGDQQR